jgi:hypothetical protein
MFFVRYIANIEKRKEILICGNEYFYNVNSVGAIQEYDKAIELVQQVAGAYDKPLFSKTIYTVKTD